MNSPIKSLKTISDADKEKDNFSEGVAEGVFAKRKTTIKPVNMLNMSTELTHYDKNSLSTKNKKFSLKMILQIKVPLEGRSLGVFRPMNKFRVLCSTISQHWLFSLFILVIILATTIFVALESPLNDPEDPQVLLLKKFDNVITLLFTLEAILKIVTLGFIRNGPHSYIRSPWNMIDFLIVIVSIIDFLEQQTSSASTIKTLRVARLLRPIRIIATNRALKSALTSLIKSVPKILELLFLVVLVLFMFAMLETQLFSGKFYYCYMEHLDYFSYKMSQSLIKDKWDCLNYGGEWVKP